MLNVISTSEKNESATADVGMTSIQTSTSGVSDTYNLLTGNSPLKPVTSYAPKPSGIPLASGSSSVPYSRPVSTPFAPRVDASALTSGMVPVLPVLTAPTERPTSVQVKASPPKATSTGVATGMSVKEMIGNISKRKSSLPVAAAGGYSGTTTPTDEDGSRSPSATINKLSDELLKKCPAREGRSASPVYPRPTNSSLLRKSPSAKGLGGTGVVKWGDGPGASSTSERSRGGRSVSPHERDSDLTSLNGSDSLYCASTGRKINPSASDSSREPNGMPYEVGSVRGVVASWDHRENAHVRDTAKSRATKEATMQKEVLPGSRVSLLEKRCTF